MALSQPLFAGDSGIDQLVEIIKILGTPTREQIHAMNPSYTDHKFPQIKPFPLEKLFRKATIDGIEFIAQFLHYDPKLRPSAIQAMGHRFLDELRYPNTKLPESMIETLDSLFNSSAHGKFSLVS
jgi:glycogen synthase kinase 3 beta